MKIVCIFCAELIRWIHPFDDLGVFHQVCDRCKRSQKPDERDEVADYYQEIGGEG